MDTRSEIREFLISRRARMTPEQVGLATYGSRRVPELRREEVAVLAGVSVPYYTRIERGEMSGVSESILQALARAATRRGRARAPLRPRPRRPADHHPRRRRPTKQPIRPSVQHILDAITGAAAFVRNDRLDVLAANALGHALYSQMFAGPWTPANAARFIFLDPQAREFYPDRNKATNDTVAVLRASADRDPYDRCLSDLVGELSIQSDEFRTCWAQHNVRQHITGIKHFHHPVVGDLSLTYDRLALVADAGLTIFTYTAEPSARNKETLKLLGSWAATWTTPTSVTEPTRPDPPPVIRSCETRSGAASEQRRTTKHHGTPALIHRGPIQSPTLTHALSAESKAIAWRRTLRTLITVVMPTLGHRSAVAFASPLSRSA